MNSLKALTATTLMATTLALAEVPQGPHQLLLNVDFAPRDVAQIEIGDFHFLPGQHAPVHTHVAPAIGYVSEGTIYFQVEGMPAQILKAGDAFYEPAGPRILHFDNASQTEKAVFTDFNLERTGEPYIIFPKPLTEKIDRRTLPTARISRRGVTKAVAYADLIAVNLPLVYTLKYPIVGYVAKGTIVLKIGDGPPQEVIAGKCFYAPGESTIHIIAGGGEAKVVTFQIRD